MFSAGMPPSVTPAERADIDAAEAAAAAYGPVVTQARNEEGDASTKYGEARQDRVTAQGQVEGDKNKFEGAEQKALEYDHSLEELKGQLDTLFNNYARTHDLANFFKQHYMSELRGDIIQAGLEAYYQNINNGLAAVVAYHAAIIKFGAVLAGLHSSLDSNFHPVSYIQAKEPAQDQSPQYYANANSELSNYNANLEQFNKKKNDPFYDNLVAEALAELKEAKLDLGELEAVEADAQTYYEDLRDDVMDALEHSNELNAEARETSTEAATD